MQCKQMELGDSMDLSSYLLKPVQRISKYSLLLQEMLEECGVAHDAEHLEIQGAAEVVQFQLRHGNDLLTMDAIQDCDVSKISRREAGEIITVIAQTFHHSLPDGYSFWLSSGELAGTRPVNSAR